VTDVVLCAVCGTEQRQNIGVACDQCAGRLRARLRGVPDLLTALQETTARLDRIDSDGTGTGDDEQRTLDHRYPLTAAVSAVPFDGRAAAAHAHLLDVVQAAALTAWPHLARPCTHHSCPLAVFPHHGPPCLAEARRRAHRAAAVTDPARYLADHAGILRRLTDYPTLHADISDAVRHGWRIVDQPAERRELGICAAPTPDGPCPVHLSARVQDATVTCPGCGTTHDVLTRQDALALTADDILLTAADCARALTGLDHPVTDAMVRGWRRLGHIQPIDVNPHGQPLYRFGDVRACAKKIRYGITPPSTAPPTRRTPPPPHSPDLQ
jgi:hypothetical protein